MNHALTKDIVFEDGTVIPAGFISDGITAPGWFLRLFKPMCRIHAVRHDWGYVIGEPKKFADDQLCDAIAEAGNPWWVGKIILVILGWVPYYLYRHAEKKLGKINHLRLHFDPSYAVDLWGICDAHRQ